MCKNIDTNYRDFSLNTTRLLTKQQPILICQQIHASFICQKFRPDQTVSKSMGNACYERHLLATWEFISIF